MNAADLKIRCSSLGYIMGEPQAKADKDAGNLSKTAETHCIDVFTSWYYKRREDAYSKYMDKGTSVEEDSITLLSLLTKKLYLKNEEQLSNDFITGTPDLFIMDGSRVDVVEDVKSSYDIFTFQRAKAKKLEPNYYWQIQGYLYLTGAKLGRIRYCLVNAPASLIDDEKKWLFYKVDHSTEEGQRKYEDRCKQIERNMIYDIELFRKHNPGYDLAHSVSEWVYDIPKEERMFTFEVERDEEMIEKINVKVDKCREYIKQLMP